MVTAAIATFLLTTVDTYLLYLVAALGVGVAGGAFAVGVAYTSRWFPTEKQGTALGIFGLGNVGAAVTKFFAPFVMVAMGWHAVAQIWASILLLMAASFWFFADDEPLLKARRLSGAKPDSFMKQLEPLKDTCRYGGFRCITSVYSVPVACGSALVASLIWWGLTALTLKQREC